MSEVTQILNAIQKGDPKTAENLLLLVYTELRQLAAQKLAQEKPGQTLQATALVHEAYLRLVDVDNAQQWDSRGHFFAAAAESMRRILVDQARRKDRLKRGGRLERVDLVEIIAPPEANAIDILAVDEVLEQLDQADPQAAQLVKLRYFSGLTGDQAAQVLGISSRAVDSLWSYARAWMVERLGR